MELNEKLDRVKKLMNISEGYREVDEIAQLADQVIEAFANGSNTDIVVDICVNHNNKVNFNTNYLTIKKIGEKGNYNIIADFINKSNNIIKFSKMVHNGSFASYSNTININSALSTFIPYLMEIFTKYELNGKKSGYDVLSKTKEILIDAMTKAFRSVMIHELQHAYDSFVSNDRYRTDDKSIRYYQRTSDENGVMQNSKRTPAEREVYFSLPHEYWARFSDSITQIDFEGKTMEEIIPLFQTKFKKWSEMSPTTKVRLNKALYKYFDYRKGVKKIKDAEVLQAQKDTQEKVVYSLDAVQG